ncbi:MAG TPA: hypothetical protein VLB27_12410, partial [candidate division Zixibacteria bacterium]|nr:hypothetical protein [candidate division Zixibacteria bacterium]
MNRKFLWRISLSLGLLAALSVSSAFGMDTDTKEKLRKIAITTQKYALPSDGSAELERSGTHGQSTAGQYIGATSSASALGCTPNTGHPDRGLTFGCTYYDYQKNGSMNRQIATDPVFHIINFTWMNQDNNSATGGRNVRYEAFDPAFGALGDGTGGVDVGGDLIPPNRSGYVTIAGVSDGTAVNSHHWNPTFDVGIYRAWVFKNSTPGLADFGGLAIPDSVWASYDNGTPGSGDQFIWPRVGHTDNGATQVTHVILHNDNTNNTVGNNFLYTRRVGTSGDAWSHGMEFGWGGYLSPVICAQNASNNVALAWSGGRGDGTPTNCTIDRSNGLLSGQTDNDIYVMQSTDAGASWGACFNVTQRPDSLPGGFAPGSRLTAVYDQAGNLHVVWQATQWNGYAGPFTYRGRFFHWDAVGGNIRTVFDFVWDPIECNGGVFNLNASQPQLSECDGKLYVTFSYFAPVPEGRGDDCSVRASSAPAGAANGDIWVTVSDNDGFNWDPPRNLTDSYTPACDTIAATPAPDCHSDTWHSATRYGIDITGDIFSGIADLSANLGGYAGANYLFVGYVNDSDPGGGIRPEGGWTISPLRVFRFGCVEIVPAAVLASNPFPEGQSMDDPAHVLPGSDSVITWTLENTGNIPLTYSINIINDVPAGNITVVGGTGTLSNGLTNSEDLTFTMNAALENTEQHAHAEVEITGNFIGSPKTYVFDYTIGQVQLLEPVYIGPAYMRAATVDTPLVIANNGNVGFQNNNGAGRANLDHQGSAAECDTTGNADSYMFDGSPLIAYPGDGGNIVVSSMFDFSIVDSFQFRPLESPSGSEDGSFWKGTSGVFTTQDSTIGLRTDYWIPKSGVPSGWHVVYARTAYFAYDDGGGASAQSSVKCAYAWDWDVPSDSGSRNTSGIDVTNNFIWQRGSEFGADTGNTACKPNDRRFAAAGYYPTADVADYDDFATGTGAGNAGFQAQYTRDNATFVGGDWDHPKMDSMLTNIAGFNVYTTSAADSLLGVDLHMVLNTGSYDINPGDTVYLHMMWLTGIAPTNNPDGVLATTWSTWYTKAPWGGCCDKPGDFDNSGSFNIGDVTAGIAFIFSGGPAAACP